MIASASGELRPVVDAHERAVVGQQQRRHGPVVGDREVDERGEVQLAGRGRRRDQRQVSPEPDGVERVEPALISVSSSSSSVASRSSTMARTRPSSSRTTRPRPVGSRESTDTSAIAASDLTAHLEQGRHEVRGEQRHVAAQHDHLGRALRQRPRAPARTASAVPRGSSWTAKSARSANTVPDLVGGRRDDHERAPPGRRGRGLEDVAQHGHAAHGMEDLGQARPHPRAEARGEDDRDGVRSGDAGHGVAVPAQVDGGWLPMKCRDCTGVVVRVSNVPSRAVACAACSRRDLEARRAIVPGSRRSRPGSRAP